MSHVAVAPVSVVIPCFNCGSTLQRAVTSVLRQSMNVAEVILVDDASSDSTWAVLTDIERTHPGRFKLIRLAINQGAASARNAAWAVASQPYIAFLDADDAWHPEKIRMQLTYMQDHPDVVLSGHGHRMLSDVDAQPDWVPALGPTGQIRKWPLLVENRFVTPSVMLRRDISQRFSQGKRHMEDRLLWLEVVLDGHKAVCLGVDLVATYKRPYGTTGLSSDIWQMTLADVYNYRVLHAAGRLSLGATWLLMVFSVVKFMRRLCLLMIWRRRGDR